MTQVSVVHSTIRESMLVVKDLEKGQISSYGLYDKVSTVDDIPPDTVLVGAYVANNLCVQYILPSSLVVRIMKPRYTNALYLKKHSYFSAVFCNLHISVQYDEYSKTLTSSIIQVIGIHSNKSSHNIAYFPVQCKNLNKFL